MDNHTKKGNNSFGIVITTYIGDIYLTKALLASIKMYLPELPICLIQDGSFELGDITSIYNITHVLRKENVKDEFLRENCFGSRCTNMIAFWECPFDKFLYLDSDLVLWGNVLKNIDLSLFDFIHNTPHERYTERVYKGQYFDYDRLFNHVEAFPWQECHFFNAGVFIARRGIFNIDAFKVLFFLWKKDKSLMPAEPQGMINYLVFKNASDKRIQISETHLQTVVPVKTNLELETIFSFDKNGPIIIEDSIIHWAGLKPLITNNDSVFLTPMVYFRKVHLKNANSIWRFFPILYFYYEEYSAILNRYHNGSILKYIYRKLFRVFTNFKP